MLCALLITAPLAMWERTVCYVKSLTHFHSSRNLREIRAVGKGVHFFHEICDLGLGGGLAGILPYAQL